jgi:hypothetical protein
MKYPGVGKHGENYLGVKRVFHKFRRRNPNSPRIIKHSPQVAINIMTFAAIKPYVTYGVDLGEVSCNSRHVASKL